MDDGPLSLLPFPRLTCAKDPPHVRSSRSDATVAFAQIINEIADTTDDRHFRLARRRLVDHPRLGFLVAEERRARLALDLQDVEAVDEVVAHDRRLLAVGPVRKQKTIILLLRENPTRLSEIR